MDVAIAAVYTAAAERLGIESGAVASLLDGGDTGVIPDKSAACLELCEEADSAR
jgi:hypothetical protein